MHRPTRLRLAARLAPALFGAAAFLLAPAPSALADHARTGHSDSGRYVAGGDHTVQQVGHRGHSRHRGHFARHRGHHDRHYGHHRGNHGRHFGHQRGHHGRHYGHYGHYGKHYKKHHGKHRKHYGHSYGYYDGYGHHGKVRVYRHSSPYYCAPCNHYFRSRHSFHDHVHSYHHIPLVKLPFVIVRSALGWIFYG